MLQVVGEEGAEGYTLVTATLIGTYDVSDLSDLVLTFVSESESVPASAIDFGAGVSFGSADSDGFSVTSASHGLTFSTAAADSFFEDLLDMEAVRWEVENASAQGQSLAFAPSLNGGTLSDLVVELQVSATDEILNLGAFLIGGTTSVESFGIIDLGDGGPINPNRFMVSDTARLYNDRGNASFVDMTGDWSSRRISH